MSFIAEWIHQRFKDAEAKRSAERARKALELLPLTGELAKHTDNVCVLVQPRFKTREGHSIEIIDTDDPPPKRAA